MTGRMDEKLHKKQPQRPLLYVICHYGPPNQIVILYGGEGGSLSHLASGSWGQYNILGQAMMLQV
jgi:hypothetical protein